MNVVRPLYKLAGLACLISLFTAFSYGQNQIIVLPPIDVGATELAQVNVMSSAVGYVGWTYLANCEATVTFYDASGAVIGNSTKFTLGQKPQVFSAQLPYSSIGATISRPLVTAQIALAAEPYSVSALSPPIPPCTISYSLAAVDFTTGAVRSFSAGQASGTDQVAVGSISPLPCISNAYGCALYLYGDLPSQLLVLPPVTIAPSETLRVAVTSAAAGDKQSVVACKGTIGFYDVTGAPIGAPAVFDVGQKQSINAAELTFATAGGTGLNGVASAQISLTALPLTVAYTGGTSRRVW